MNKKLGRRNLKGVAGVVRKAAWKGYEQRTGRRADLHICPGCGHTDSFTNMVAHFSTCPERQNRLTQAEWFSELAIGGGPKDGVQYLCPVGCGEYHHYRDMIHHIPDCPSQSEFEPYTVAKWQKHLIDHREQPGADIIDERRKAKHFNPKAYSRRAS